MGYFDWLFGRKTKTGSVRQKAVVVDAGNAREAALRHGFKFFDYIIEGIRLAGIDQKQNGNVYEVYHCDTRAVALRFLGSIPQTKIPPRYYVIVETPGGNVGRDVNGTFDE